MYINLITIDLCPGQGGGGVKPSGTLNISENGEYDVYSYSSASVDVHPSTSLSETYISNGSYNITGEFNGGVITVDVPAPQFVTETLNVSANGTYNPGQGIDGYSQVVVDVPQSGWGQKDLTEGTIEIINLDNSASFVASSAFKNNTTIQTVNLPYATSVGNSAFYSCNSLSQVSLPMCSYIGNYAFNYCSSLSQVSLPMCLSIGSSAFTYCSSLSQVSLPNVNIIGNFAFSNTGIISVDFNCSVIGYSAFYYCNSLLTVNLPNVNNIQYNTFTNCKSLTTVSLSNCKGINRGAFMSCYSLNSLSLPVCTYINEDAFNKCESLTSLDLPACSEIGISAFNQCNLSIISLSVCTKIDSYAFRYNTNLMSVYIYTGQVCSIQSNVFVNTPIASGIGSIYVPASLVDVYKSAANWSYFSTQIFPISE